VSEAKNTNTADGEISNTSHIDNEDMPANGTEGVYHI